MCPKSLLFPIHRPSRLKGINGSGAENAECDFLIALKFLASHTGVLYNAYSQRRERSVV